jgi:hypothetical protein
VISLDSVVYADGTMAGPDTMSKFVFYNATLAADRDFAAAVLALQSGSAAALRNSLITLPADEGKTGRFRTTVRITGVRHQMPEG